MFAPRGRLLSSRPDISDAYAPVTVYGTSWCAASQQVRRFLDRMGIPYNYYDIERDRTAAQRLRWWTGGYASHPTVQIGDELLIEPNLRELEWTLTRQGY
jgi:mycoredoxin